MNHRNKTQPLRSAISLALACVVLAGFSSHSDKITGKYDYHNMYDSHYVHLKSNHSFYKDEHSCTWGSVTKGKWSLKADTLTLSNTHYKARRYIKEYRPSSGTEIYLVRKDTLIELSKTDSGRIVRQDVLIRK